MRQEKLTCFEEVTMMDIVFLLLRILLGVRLLVMDCKNLLVSLGAMAGLKLLKDSII